VSGFALSFIQGFDEVTMTVLVASSTIVPLPVRMLSSIQGSIASFTCAAFAPLILCTAFLMLIIDRAYGLERLFVDEDKI
jgi:putative spermidine/putrescine transport system permease protein